MRKWFRVATEGTTTDGRRISRAWIEQMARHYDPKVYGARVWLEHMRGMFADGPFPALGDVTAVKAEENDAGKLELFAEIDPTEQLQQFNQQRQKVYTSIEVDPEFADTGEAYLVGLAVTDSPASLGTEMLQFSATSTESPLAARKQSAHNLFTAAIETELDFTEADKPRLLDTVKALFNKHREAGKAEFADFRADLEATLALFVEKTGALETELAKRPTLEQFQELRERFNQLHRQLDETPDTEHRSRATGDEADRETASY